MLFLNNYLRFGVVQRQDLLHCHGSNTHLTRSCVDWNWRRTGRTFTSACWNATG